MARRGQMEPVPLRHARFEGGFWGPRLETNRRVTLRAEYEQCKQTGRIDNLRLDWTPESPVKPHIFWDSDVAKWLEAASYALIAEPDPELARLADEVAALIVGAQQPDGYLNTYFTAVEPAKRWTNLRDCHELYCAGHLIEAAVAYAEATGRRELLDALCRYADLIGRTFGRGHGKRRGYCGHEEIELALVKLYRATGRGRYLKLAEYFINERGRRPHYFDIEARARGEEAGHTWPSEHEAPYAYFQAHAPVREQQAAEGHAVRAMYLCCGMADVAAETGDRELLAACRRLWQSVTQRRMYVTGGIGSAHHGERLTLDYDLPNETAYAETCAAIGLVFFAHRMLHLDPEGRYADVMERALYNGVLSGVSLDGARFFYVNPLAADPAAARFHRLNSGSAGVERQGWFSCACCPPNVARLLASLPAYAYSQGPRTAWVHLYAQGRAELRLGARSVALYVSTRYPWREDVRIVVRPDRPTTFTLALRVPGWCRRPRVQVNAAPVALAGVTRGGYARLRREWREGDRVDLTLPMPVERVEASPQVRADCGRVALQRGPVVYCLEEADNGPNLRDIALPRRARLRAAFRPGLLGGVTVITGTGVRRDAASWGDELYRPGASRRTRVRLTAVPYYAWCNREPGEMLVWLAEES